MNKKIFGVLGLGVLLALTACGGGKSYSDTILADTDHPSGWVIAGPDAITVGAGEGESIGSWNSKSAEEYARSFMTATSIKAVSQKSTDVADKLVAADVTQLYMIEHVHLGMKDAGGNIEALVNGQKAKFNGSRQLKVYQVNYDEEDEVYSPDLWIPSKEVYGESMTPDIYWTTANHSETKDEHGFDWNANPVLIGSTDTANAGIYTVVACKYKNPSSNGATHGLALILEEAKQGVPVHQLSAEFISIIGSFGEHSWDYDVDLTKNGSLWTTTMEFAEGDSFKLRVDHAWDASYGFDALTDSCGGAFEDDGGNIGVVTGGNYKVTFDASTEKITIVAAN